MQVDMTSIVQATIALIVAVVTAFVVPWIKTRTTAAQQEQLAALVSVAVAAAEQIFAGAGRGTEKKQWVLDWLAERGLKVDMATIDAAVEAAVFGLR